MSQGILDVDNVEGSRVPFPIDDGSNTTQVVSTSDHDQVAWNKIINMYRLQVKHAIIKTAVLNSLTIIRLGQ